MRVRVCACVCRLEREWLREGSSKLPVVRVAGSSMLSAVRVTGSGMLSAVRVSQRVTHPTCFGTSLLPLRGRAARRPWAASL